MGEDDPSETGQGRGMDGYFSWGIQRGRYPLWKEESSLGTWEKQNREIRSVQDTRLLLSLSRSHRPGSLVDFRTLFDARPRTDIKPKPSAVLFFVNKLPIHTRTSAMFYLPTINSPINCHSSFGIAHPSSSLFSSGLSLRGSPMQAYASFLQQPTQTPSGTFPGVSSEDGP
jgi:hypothetical protein